MFRRTKRQQAAPGDFHVFLHEVVRTPHLTRLPAGARTILHGGSAGNWYFEWFSKHYPTEPQRQIGVDAYSAEPEGLAASVEWLPRTLGDLGPIEDGTVDLVYAGQVIEHLWPDEVVGFLCETHRVLRPGGVLALDSPNRRVTAALDWNHPEHTIEFTVDEIVSALELAGFDPPSVRGLWLCYDSERDRALPLEALEDEGRFSWSRRLALAEERPEDSFIWWAEATRGSSKPNRPALETLVGELFRDYRRLRLSRFQHEVGSEQARNGVPVVSAREGEQGHLLFGPFAPMPPGRWTARFRLSAGPPRRRDRVEHEETLGAIDVAKAIEITQGLDAEPVAERSLTAADVPPDGRSVEVELPFELEQTAFAVQFRVRTSGRVRLSAAFLGVDEVGPAASGMPHVSSHTA